MRVNKNVKPGIILKYLRISILFSGISQPNSSPIYANPEIITTASLFQYSTLITKKSWIYPVRNLSPKKHWKLCPVKHFQHLYYPLHLVIKSSKNCIFQLSQQKHGDNRSCDQ